MMPTQAPVTQQLESFAAQKPISPGLHSLLDYLLLLALLVVPPLLRFPDSVIKLYRAQGLILMGYVAITDQPYAVKPLLPFQVHSKADPVVIGLFALQSGLEGFRQDKRALAFNLFFAAASTLSVLLTDFNGKTKTRG